MDVTGALTPGTTGVGPSAATGRRPPYAASPQAMRTGTKASQGIFKVSREGGIWRPVPRVSWRGGLPGFADAGAKRRAEDRVIHPGSPRAGGRPRARVAFAAAYLTLQGALVASAGRRPDHAFGFQMFSESCAARLALLREIDAPSGHGTLVIPAARGEWTADDGEGTRHPFEWRDRVHKLRSLSTLDVLLERTVRRGRRELSRVQAALERRGTSHTDEDDETRASSPTSPSRRNGREPTVVRLASAERHGRPR